MKRCRIDAVFGNAWPAGVAGRRADSIDEVPAGQGWRGWRASARPPRRVGGTVAALAAALLGACGSSPPIRYHALSPIAVAEGARVAYAGPVLEVGSVQVPPALTRPELVRETAAGRFEIREFDYWAAPLPRLSRQALAEDLADRLPAGKLVYPGASWPSPGAVLEVDVLSFRVSGGRATMVSSWSLRSRPGEAAAPAAGSLRGAQLRLEVPVAESSPQATTAAWSALLGQLADRIVGELAGAGPGP